MKRKARTFLKLHTNRGDLRKSVFDLVYVADRKTGEYMTAQYAHKLEPGMVITEHGRLFKIQSIEKEPIAASELKPNDYPKSIRDVKKMALKYGSDFFHGPGYFYFQSPNGLSFRDEGVYVYKIDELTMGQWEQELKDRIEDAKKRQSRMASDECIPSDHPAFGDAIQLYKKSNSLLPSDAAVSTDGGKCHDVQFPHPEPESLNQQLETLRQVNQNRNDVTSLAASIARRIAAEPVYIGNRIDEHSDQGSVWFRFANGSEWRYDMTARNAEIVNWLASERNAPGKALALAKKRKKREVEEHPKTKQGPATQTPVNPAPEVPRKPEQLEFKFSRQAVGELLHVARELIAGPAIPVEIGDTILLGKFKNRKAIVKGFGLGKLNQPVVVTDKGTIPLFKFRIPKLIKTAEASQYDTTCFPKRGPEKVWEIEDTPGMFVEPSPGQHSFTP